MRIAYIFASGQGDSGGCCRRYDYGDSSNYEFEDRNRGLGDDKAGEFNDRDTPVPMFRGNRAGPLS